MKGYFLSLLLVVALASCKSDRSRGCASGEDIKSTKDVPITTPCDLPVSSVGVVENGDTLCYRDLLAGWCEEEEDFLLPYALLMSMKYNRVGAYSDAYYSLKTKPNMQDIDPTTIKLIQYCEYKLRQSEKYQDCAQWIVESFARDSVDMSQYEGNGLFEYLMDNALEK